MYTKIERSPGTNTSVQSIRINYDAQWAETVSDWVRLLRAEINAPDLWSSVFSGPSAVVQATATQTGNDPFSAAERAQVVIFLAEIRQYLQSNQRLSPKQLVIVEDKLRYLEEAAERFGRKDWLHLFLGMLLSTAVQIGMDQNVFQDLLSFAGHVFQQLLGHFLLLPLPH